MTPQTLENDISDIEIDRIVLLVIDECHKSIGEYSYCKVVQYLDSYKQSGYRVVGLSASPGNDKEKIKEIVVNLNIS